MPRDIREYLLRRYLKPTIESLRTPEQKRELAKQLLETALNSEDPLSPDLVDELMATAMKLWDRRSGICGRCGFPLTVPVPAQFDDEYYCPKCHPDQAVTNPDAPN